MFRVSCEICNQGMKTSFKELVVLAYLDMVLMTSSMYSVSTQRKRVCQTKNAGIHTPPNLWKLLFTML